MAIQSAFSYDWEWLNLWGIQGVANTWQSKNLNETPFSYAAMIFCGYWNEEYAGFNGHFSGNHVKTALTNQNLPFHGPPPMSDANYSEIFKNKSPRLITQILRNSINESSKFYFNHQNSWSNTDLISLMNKYGLRNIVASNDEIISFMHHIPTIKEMDNMSNYFLFER